MVMFYWVLGLAIISAFLLGSIIWKRSLAAVLVMSLVLLAPFGLTAHLSNPLFLNSWNPYSNILKPSSEEDAEVLASLPIPGHFLYLWVRTKGSLQPQYYALVWTDEVEKLAQKLQDIQEKGGVPIIGNLFDRSLELEEPFTVHPLPALKQPLPKEEPPQGKSFST